MGLGVGLGLGLGLGLGVGLDGLGVASTSRAEGSRAIVPSLSGSRRGRSGGGRAEDIACPAA